MLRSCWRLQAGATKLPGREQFHQSGFSRLRLNGKILVTLRWYDLRHTFASRQEAVNKLCGLRQQVDQN
jgi:hypothetical protein